MGYIQNEIQMGSEAEPQSLIIKKWKTFNIDQILMACK